jgi:hypothetical protein
MEIYSTRTEKDQGPLLTLVRRATGVAAGRRYTGVRLTGIRDGRGRRSARATGGRIMIHDTGASSTAGKGAPMGKLGLDETCDAAAQLHAAPRVG